MPCMLCKKSGRIFNVYTNYGNANHNVRDDLIEIFGVDAEPYLAPSDCVCNVCMNMLDNVAKLKRRLWPLICHSNQETKAIKLGKIWDIFASLKIEEGDDDEEPAIPCRTPTPSNLLAFNYSKAYNRTLENKIADIERHRSLSRTSSVYGRSDASETSEVRNIFRRRGKRKGHNWTRRKRSATRASATSASSQRTYLRRSKTRSPLSECSYISSYDSCYISSHSMKKSPVKKRAVEYDEHGRLIRKRTRSVSRAQEKEARYLELLESTKFYCSERDCPLYFEDLDVLNHHRIMDHDILALYFCDECQEKYTTWEHLKLHQKSHDILPFLCLLCQYEVKNQEALQEHLEEHLVYSVPCKYCDKAFLNKKMCESHIKAAHGGSRERIVYKERIILDRVDKEEGSSTASNKKKSDDLENVIHIIPYTDMECNEEDLEVTTENLRLMNVDFYDDDPSTDESEILSESLIESLPKRTVSSDGVVLSPIDSVELDTSEDLLEDLMHDSDFQYFFEHQSMSYDAASPIKLAWSEVESELQCL